MLRRYPLTALLLIATIVVNVVFVTVDLPGRLDRRALFAGLLLGEMGAFAIWAARGSGHRLARVSLLVIASCLIGLATGGSAMLDRYQWLAILVGYTFSVYLLAVFISFIRKTAVQRSGVIDSEPTWQVSLIELFGWTILVAIASFAARFMEFRFFRLDNHILEKAILLLILPTMLAANIRNDLRDLSRGWAFRIVLVVATTVTAYALHTHEPHFALPLILGQGGYLVLWYFVLGMDRIVDEARQHKERLIETNDSQGKG